MPCQVLMSRPHTRQPAPKRRAGTCAQGTPAPQRTKEGPVQQIRLAVSSKAHGNNSLDKARVQAGDEEEACMPGWRADRQRRASRLQKIIPPYHADMAISRHGIGWYLSCEGLAH